MSRPRAATSVHRSVPADASENSKNVEERFCCFCLPWMSMTLMSMKLSSSEWNLTELHEEKKTMTCIYECVSVFCTNDCGNRLRWQMPEALHDSAQCEFVCKLNRQGPNHIQTHLLPPVLLEKGEQQQKALFCRHHDIALLQSVVCLVGLCVIHANIEWLALERQLGQITDLGSLGRAEQHCLPLRGQKFQDFLHLFFKPDF